MIDWLFTTALAALALATIAAILIWTFRPSPAVRHALWLIVVLKLVSPTGLVVSVPLPVEPPKAVVAAPPEQLPQAEDYVVHEELFTVVVRPKPGQTPEEAALAAMHSQQSAGPKTVTGTPSDSELAPAPNRSINFRPWLLGLWLAGALVIAMRQLRETWRFARFTRKSVPAGAALVAEAALVAKRLGVRVPEVRVLTGLASPVLWCLWRPILLWPAGLECRIGGEGRRAVLAHELAHLRRRDHWARRLEMIAAVLHWWNPLFWIARRKMRADAELACDAWAAGHADRRAYAEALLEVCSFHPRRRPAPAVGVFGEGRRAMQERLTMIMRDRVPCRLAFGAKLVVALMAIAAVPAWTMGQAATPAAPAGDPQVQAIEAQIKALAEKLEAIKALRKAEGEKAAAEKAMEAQKHLRLRLADLTTKSDKIQMLKVGELATIDKKEIKVVASGDNIKVVGADGKELKDVKVIVVEGTPGEHTVVVQPVGQAKPATVKPSPANVTIKPVVTKSADGKEVTVTVVGDANIAKDKRWMTPVANDRVATWYSTTAPSSNAITLSRATYKIGKEQSAALASLLGAIKATVMETKVDGDSITVTTTPEAQRTIGQIVQLMKGAGVQGTFEYRIVPATPTTPTTPKPAKPVKPGAFFTPDEMELQFTAPNFNWSFDFDKAKIEEMKKTFNNFRFNNIKPQPKQETDKKPATGEPLKF